VTQGSLRALLLLENRLMRGAFTADRLDAVKLIAAQLAVSLDNAQLYAELTASRARIVTAADSARRRIQRDLHDGAQQHLVSLLLRLHSARITVPEASAQLAHELDDIIQGLTGAVDELREIARGIHPAALAEGGLTPALRTLARRSAVPVRLDIRTTGRLPDAVELAAYYIVAEALTNVAKHAHATSTDVSVEDDNGCLLVRIQDDGLGGADPAAGTGLMGLRDRVEALGGHLIVQSPRGKGTTLRISIPLTRPRPLVNPATP
jgi:signal transduction histidine kinase